MALVAVFSSRRTSLFSVSITTPAAVPPAVTPALYASVPLSSVSMAVLPAFAVAVYLCVDEL